MSEHTPGPQRTDEECRANASLIAAAPELLEALVALLDSDVYADAEGLVSVSGGSTEENERAVKAARAAIANATAHQQANRRG